MFIILEGVDGSGKSSLASEIARQIRLKYPEDEVTELHSGPLKRDPLEEYVFSVDSYVPGTGHHIVADRWHYGELVYGPLYRGESAIGPACFKWIDLWLAAHGAQVTVVTNTLEEITRRLEERGEDFLQPEHVEQVIEGFNEFTDTPTRLETVVVGGEKSTVELAQERIYWAEMGEEAAVDLHDVSSTYVGSVFPEVILVGDKRGGQPPYLSQGAFLPIHGNSAAYLWNALGEGFWQNVGVINATEEFDLEELAGHFFGRPIIALGQVASKKLTKLGIKHGTVPHPQYVRRFYNKKQWEYGRLIEHVANTQEDRSKWPK